MAYNALRADTAPSLQLTKPASDPLRTGAAPGFNMLFAIAALFSFQLLGELISRLTGLPLPGALIGTLLLLLALLLYKRLPKTLEDTGNSLLQNMMLLFIPTIAGVMLEFDRLAREWQPFVIACIAGTIITFVCTGLTFKFFLQRQRLREAQALGLTHPSLSSASTADSKESV